MSYANSQRAKRAADAARQRKRYRLSRADAASSPPPDADGGSTAGGGSGAGGNASDDDVDMREALDASRFDIGACDVHDDAALLARLRRATVLSLDDAARAKRTETAEDEDLRAALRASAASASSDDADGARAHAALLSPPPPLLKTRPLFMTRPQSDLGPLGTRMRPLGTRTRPLGTRTHPLATRIALRSVPRSCRFRRPRSWASVSVSSSTREGHR